MTEKRLSDRHQFFDQTAMDGESRVRLMDSHKVFKSLTRNAFDFLQQAIGDFDKKPKYSVIHFCAAVEMLLKARLMREHWSLIVSKPEEASISKLMSGDFFSVTLAEARERIQNIVGESIADDAFNSFRTLAKHRNKMIHFFHAEIDRDEQVKAQIVAEQCRSWLHLHRLLSQWGDHFKEFKSDISRADLAMKRHRKYLNAKFKVIEKELKSEGKTGKKCSSCAYKAAVPDWQDEQISLLRCLVCDHSETLVEIGCPHCDTPVVLYDEGFANCEECGEPIEPEEVAYALTDQDARRRIADGDDGSELGNCKLCGGNHTVVKRNDGYFCANCFKRFDSVKQCGWCNEPSTGDMELSYVYGCGQCQGKLGWEKDH